MFSKFWSCYKEAQEDLDDTNMIQMNQVFAHRSKEDEIYLLTVKKIIEAQQTTLDSNTSLNTMLFQIKD